VDALPNRVHEGPLPGSGTSVKSLDCGVKMLGAVNEVALLEVERGLRCMCDG